ncbi:hypothetical protein H0486_05450 [Lachnospiraceae bacterium MD1]|uniref:Uncharacterized protein n=1 Tax=Variimorphobacter saccharofermentans TaxID=2755051 RepID=A0A839JYL2_9FIRM|nr:hypothetical protein [Variimorphobacter saccharofermentans]MBB2182318.1 hypothetical protein [Variimorphobacter saccharofermentans]
MKLKYKKIILFTTMSTMGIGLLTLSITQDKPKAKESVNGAPRVEASLLSDTSSTSVDEVYETTAVASPTEMPSATITPEPTEAPTPTPLPVYEIEKEGYPEIEELFKKYYVAKNNCDVDQLKSILSNPTKVESQEQLQKKTEYIDEYQKIKPYVKKGAQKGTYIVYVYHEIKFTSVNTPAPSLSKFYVITDARGDLKIFSGEMDEELKAYYDARNTDEDVVEIINMTNKKSEEAKEKDEDLLNFWKSIEKLTNNNKKSDTDTKNEMKDSSEAQDTSATDNQEETTSEE